MAAREAGLEIVGIRNGYEGLLFPDRYPDRGLVSLTPGSVDDSVQSSPTLGTSRVNPFHVRAIKDEAVEEVDRSDELLGVLRKEGIDGVISVAGRGAMSVVQKLSRKGLKTVCVPESVENDVDGTALSFGFNSALSFSIELLDSIRAAARATRKIAVVEVPGEHTGWLALQAGIAALADAVLIPEIPYDLNKVAAHLTCKRRDSAGAALVVVAEGVPSPQSSSPQSSALQSSSLHKVAEDPIENMRRALSPGASAEGTGDGRHAIRRSGVVSEVVASELQRRVNVACRSFALDPILRGGQTTAVDRQIGLAYGAAAVRGLKDGRSDEMVVFEPPRLAFVPLADAVNKVRTVPPDSEFVSIARALGISLGE